ncbi:MAG: ABC-2 transporter permease [Candidatus Marinimicrobia bacterium]|nr:ABC-2 transporter permease [Candidatus Neomarinimicrobiota bacterium]
MRRTLQIAKMTFGIFLRRPEVLMVAALGFLLITGVSMVLLNEDLARQVSVGIQKSQGIEIEKKTFIEGSLVYAEIFTVIASFLVGMSLIGRDIKSNSISLYLVKPITRVQYLLGKYLGGVLLSVSIFLFYLIFITIVLYIDGGAVQIPFFKIILLTFFKIALLYSIIIFFVQKMPGFVAALLGSAIYIGGYFAGDFYLMSLSTEGLIKYTSALVYYFLPHMVNVSPGSVMSSSTDLSVFFRWAFVYGLLYSGIWLYGALKLFNKRAL